MLNITTHHAAIVFFPESIWINKWCFAHPCRISKWYDFCFKLYHMFFSIGQVYYIAFLHHLHLWWVKVFPWGWLSQRFLLIFPERWQTPALQHICFKQEAERKKYVSPTYSICSTPAVKPNTSPARVARPIRWGVTDTGGSEIFALPLNFLLNSGWTLLVWMGDTRQSLFARKRWSVKTTSRLTEQLAVPVPLLWLR